MDLTLCCPHSFNHMVYFAIYKVSVFQKKKKLEVMTLSDCRKPSQFGLSCSEREQHYMTKRSPFFMERNVTPFGKVLRWPVKYMQGDIPGGLFAVFCCLISIQTHESVTQARLPGFYFLCFLSKPALT